MSWYPSWCRTLAVVASMIVLTGCATSTTSEPPKERDNELLNDGYTFLYEAVSGMRFSDELLLLKIESDRFDAVISEVAEYASSMKAQLEQVAEDYPAVEIDRDSLPAIEKDKRGVITKDRVKSLAPLVGLSGEAFERTMLLSSSGALNQTRYLTQVMAENEPDNNLRRFLRDAESEFLRLYERVVVLLNEDYFIHNTFEPGKG